MEYVKIPKDRVGALIGKDGSVKTDIEKRLSVKLDINTDEGFATVENAGGDILAEWKARDIIRAVARGMNPEKALRLCSDDYVLELIELADVVGRSDKAITRQKGRLIGEGGKTREYLEEMTGAYVSIYGKTVALVGVPEEVGLAKEIIMMIATGIPHGVAYKVLQRKRRELKEKQMGLWKNVNERTL